GPRCCVKDGGRVRDGELGVCADDGAVEQAPNGCNRVRVYLAAYPCVAAVVDVLVARVVVGNAAIRAVGVRVDGLRVVVHNVFEKALDALARRVGGYAESDAPAALNRTENDGLVVTAMVG